MNKVLVITYYWPPAGGPGVQRWLNFVINLPKFGIEPVLYIPDNPGYPIIDDSLLEKVPEDITIYKNRITEPMKWAGKFFQKDVKRISSGIISDRRQSYRERFLLWIRGNFFIPDARVLWVNPSVRYLSRIILEENINTVVTTGPPHSLHLIGRQLKRKFGIRWVADFRDPWTSIGYHEKLLLGRRARRRHKLLEKGILNSADKILVTSKSTASEFKRLTDKPIRVITNGYEHADFEGPVVQLDKKFTVSHIGSLLSGRNPEILWDVLQEIARENMDFKKMFSLQLAGAVSREVVESIENHGLQIFLDHKSYIPHNEAVNMQKRSQVLLLVEIDSPETKGILPGKLYEYLAAGRPILAIGPDGWEAGELILETGAGLVFDYTDRSGLKNAILNWFERYRQESLQLSPRGIGKYSRRELTASLAKELIWE